ncbi:MAG: hypothetical protein LQ339_000878 [Xanthoria mediterranea]|nr:MAG: hypothetical protein LQ339_000878 [Xanthoria mediterranea]
MSPSAVSSSASHGHFQSDLNLSLRGLGVEYPPFLLGPEALDTLANRFYPPSAALKKVLSINRFTGIETRAAVGDVDHPLVNQPNPPSIKELNDLFRLHGVPLSVKACRKAIQEWGGSVDDITHIVSTTCTNSANPGFDHFVVKELGIRSSIEKILLHGIGCSGGMAAMRTAAHLALGASYQRKPARVLVVACEVSSALVRSELDSINEHQQTRVGACLFSDCASAAILSNGVGEDPSAKPIFDLLGWKHQIIDDTEEDLGFDVDPLGWKVVLTQRVPTLAAAAVSPCFQDLVESVPAIDKDARSPIAADFDWALHPGGSLIITGVEQAMNLTPEHLRASYEIYMKYGNSSSATILSVLNKLRESEGKENVVACAFGPGIALEMMLLRRHKTGPASVNGAESDGTSESRDAAGAAVQENITNGNGVPHMNGNPITTNGAAAADDDNNPDGPAAGASSSAEDISQHSGATAADGEASSGPKLPVEDVD